MTYYNPFFVARLKIDRASKHLGELISIVSVYGLNHHGGHANVLRPSLYEVLPVVGDVVHNLRSALDIIACDLVIDAEGPKNRDQLKNIAFPVSLSEPEFANTLKRCNLSNISKAISDTLYRFQPWPEGGFGFWDLHQLSILDKHRTGINVWRWASEEGGSPLAGDVRTPDGFPSGPPTLELRFEDDRPYFWHPFPGQDVARALIDMAHTCGKLIQAVEPHLVRHKDLVATRVAEFERRSNQLSDKAAEIWALRPGMHTDLNY